MSKFKYTENVYSCWKLIRHHVIIKLPEVLIDSTRSFDKKLMVRTTLDIIL